MTILSKAIQRFNAKPIKIQSKFFTDIEWTILNFMWKNKKPRIAKTILYNKGTSRGISIHDFKLYNRATVVKISWYWHKKHTGGPMKSNQRPGYQSTHLWTPDFWQAEIIKWKKESIFNKWCWHNWISACRRMQIDPYLSPCTKLKSKWIKDLNINPTTLNLREEKTRSSLQCMGTRDHILCITPVAQALRETINK